MGNEEGRGATHANSSAAFDGTQPDTTKTRVEGVTERLEVAVQSDGMLDRPREQKRRKYICGMKMVTAWSDSRLPEWLGTMHVMQTVQRADGYRRMQQLGWRQKKSRRNAIKQRRWQAAAAAAAAEKRPCHECLIFAYKWNDEKCHILRVQLQDFRYDSWKLRHESRYTECRGSVGIKFQQQTLLLFVWSDGDHCDVVHWCSIRSKKPLRRPLWKSKRSETDNDPLFLC